MREFKPKRSNQISKTVTMGFFVIALAAIFFSSLPQLAYRSVMQMASLLLLAIALALFGRYELRSYSYALVEDGEGGIDLTVTELKKRSRITVCRISLSSIEKADVLTKAQKKQQKKERASRKSFNYCVDMSPEETLRILATEGGEKYIIYLSHVPELSDILKKEG